MWHSVHAYGSVTQPGQSNCLLSSRPWVRIPVDPQEDIYMGYTPTDPPPPPPGRGERTMVAKRNDAVALSPMFSTVGKRAVRINLMPKRMYKRAWPKFWKKIALSKNEVALRTARKKITRETTSMFIDGLVKVGKVVAIIIGLYGLFWITVNFPWHLIVTVPLSIYIGVWLNNKKKLAAIQAYKKETRGGGFHLGF